MFKNLKIPKFAVMLFILSLITTACCDHRIVEGMKVLYYANIVVDYNNTPYILYAYPCELKLAYGNNNKWTYTTLTNTTYSNCPLQQNALSVLLNQQEEPVVIYQNQQALIYYNVLTGVKLSSDILLDAYSNSASFTFDSNGIFHAAYISSNLNSKNSLIYAVLNGTSWNASTIDTITSYNPLLLMSGINIPNVVYYRDYYSYNDSTLIYATLNAGQWISNTIDTPVYAANMVTDKSGNPLIGYLQNETLKLATYQSGGFIIQTIKDNSNCYGRPAITLDIQGNPIIGCVTNDSRIELFSYNGSTWNITNTTIIDSNILNPSNYSVYSSLRFPDITFDHNLNIHVIYNQLFNHDSGDPFDCPRSKSVLKYGFWDGTKWTTSVVN